jgi:RHS repeat-associated protein
MHAFRSPAPGARSRVAALRPLFIALAGLPALAAVWMVPRAGAPLLAPPPVDTVVLYGPVQFSTPTGAAQTFVEGFTAAVPEEAYQAIRIKNGQPNGTLRVDTLSVKLNDVEIITGTFDESVASVVIPVEFEEENTLEIVLAGDAGDHITLGAVAAYDARVTAYGPTQFTRLSGPLQDIEELFTQPEGAAPPDSLFIVNGNPDSTNRVPYGWITLNGDTVADPDDFGIGVAQITRAVTLENGNELIVRLGGDSGAFVIVSATTNGGFAPVATITSPVPGSATSASQVTVTGTVAANSAVTVTVNGTSATVETDNSFEATVGLTGTGLKDLIITATDAASRVGHAARQIYRDVTSPSLTVTAPQEGLITSQTSVTVIGSVSDETPTSVNVNGVPLVQDTLGGFSGTIGLSEGANVLTVTAIDAAGNSNNVVRNVTRDTQAPVLTVTVPLEGATTTADSIAVTGSVVDSTAVTVTANGLSLTVDGQNAFTGKVSLALGANVITVIATDAVGLKDTVVRNVTRQGDLPPDPSTVAPPLDPTVATTLFVATEFLYTGENPIQTGVDSGTINPLRVAVLRGRVLDRASDPVTGVTITILDHPEFGQTLSRLDGRFDLAVNGGGPLTVDYVKSGYLPVQRQVQAPWQDYSIVDDVVMIPLDTVVTTIDFSDTVEIARGSVVADSDGTRQATLLFFQGTTAQMVLPNDSVVPLSSLDVRATEYTVGETGRRAMPAVLPPSSGYTYAVELSADEALAAGAMRVEFSQPVVTYLENFIGFPVGMPVPVGTYDRGRGVWVPEDNGRVIAVLDTAGGIAALDLDGDSLPDDSTQLAALGIGDAERRSLAGLYEPGEALWRFPVTHFSPGDPNYPTRPPDDAVPPPVLPTTPDADKLDRSCTEGGSIIECQNQVLGERLALTGTPFELNYRSDRVEDFVARRRVTVPVFGESVPSSLVRATVRLAVGGQQSTLTFAPDTNVNLTMEWDGRDTYGRFVNGQYPALIQVTYSYPELYVPPLEALRAFAQYCPGDSSVQASCLVSMFTREVGEYRMVRQSVLRLGPRLAWNAVSQGIGGWSLGVHHAYDPLGQALYLGSGEQRSAREIPAATAVAGSGSLVPGGDDGPALEAGFAELADVAASPDGGFYVADKGAHVVRRVRPDGVIEAVAGTGTSGFSGDSGAATAAQLNTPTHVAVGADGSLFIVDAGNFRIRRVAPEGVITTFAGAGNIGFGGDGGPATAAGIASPAGIAAAPDGAIYLGDDVRVRKISTDGTILTIMGAGQGAGCGGDSIPAAQVCLSDEVQDVVWGPDDGLYVLDEKRLWRVAPDGFARIVAGTDSTDCVVQPGDGGPATSAGLCATSVAVTSTGQAYLTEGIFGRLRVVEPNGIIARVGTGTCFSEGGATLLFLGQGLGFGQQGPESCFEGATLLADGTLLVADPREGKVRRLRSALPGVALGDLVVASEDGSELYVFSGDGRHLETRDGLTNATQLAFAYDSAGRLASVTDANDNVTTIERNAQGEPTAIVAPFGQRTELALDTNGHLASVTNPADEPVLLAYTAGGLLTRMVNPRGDTTRFVYASTGLLERDEDAAGGFRALVRGVAVDSFTVALSSAEGRTRTYGVARVAGAEERRTTVSAAGLTTASTKIPNAGQGKTSTRTTAPDGTTTMVQTAPDPRLVSAEVLDTMEVETPLGLISGTKAIRTVELADSSNPFSLVTQTDTLRVNGRSFVNVFDAVNRTFTATTPEGRTSSGLVDSLGRVIAEVVPGVDTVKYTYDANGRLSQTTQGSRVWRYTYDARGRLDSVIDPLDRASTFAYDSADRVIEQTLPDGRTVGYGYDANGNLTGVTPPDRPAHEFSYTPVDLTASYDPPEVAEGATPTNYQYNLDRQLTRILRPNGDTVRFSYDTAGRPQGVIHQEGSLVYGYSGVGNLAAVLAPAESLAFSYDGSLLTGVTWTGPVSGEVTAEYDNDFRVSALFVNSSFLAAFSYDADGLLQGAGDLGIYRDPLNGRIDSTFLGSVTTGETYDGFGQWATRTARADSTELYRAEYTRDDLGRITGLLEVVEGDTTTFAYEYDDAGRLVEVETNGSVTASYVYDDNGNRLSVTRPGGTETGTYDDQDRLLTYAGATYGYTKAGELQLKVEGADTTFYRYDALGSVLEVNLPDGTDIEYVVDGFNRRVGKKVDGVLVQGWLYQDQLNPVAELDSLGNVVSQFIYGTRANVPDYVIKSDTTYRIMADHLGSVRLVVNVTDGTVVQRVAYDEFGREVANTNPGLQPFGYAGGLTDEQTRLVRFGARDYYPSVGRWVTKDPLGIGDEVALYVYVGNDPINSIDPLGLWQLSDLLSPGLVDFSAGLGDALLLGFGDDLRRLLGIEGVNMCSGAYTAGEWASLLIGTGRVAYAGAAKGLTLLGRAATLERALQISRYRNLLKIVFRGGLFRNFRRWTAEQVLRKYGPNAAAIVAAAGRTNVPLNMVGGGVAAGGAMSLLDDPACQCR